MDFVSGAMKLSFPEADHIFTEVFTAVVKGFALATQNKGPRRSEGPHQLSKRLS